MASSTEMMHAEETASLVGAGAAPGEENQPTVVVPPRPHNNNPNQVSEAAAADATTEFSTAAFHAAIHAAAAEAERKIRIAEAELPTLPCKPRGWRRLISFLFPGQQMLDEDWYRPKMPGYFEQLSLDRRLMEDCLHLYNSKNPGNEYEPAPGMLTQYFHFDNGTCWAHGNFVARRKSSGCFSFLPAPRTLFFFERAFRVGFDGVVTCTPVDEPVTEAYSVLGFPLWWSTRRDGKLDAICKTCYRRYELAHPGIQKKFACGHDNVRILCRMCYQQVSCVVHPYPEEFAFGH